jgi:hypothetical protein
MLAAANQRQASSNGALVSNIVLDTTSTRRPAAPTRA